MRNALLESCKHSKMSIEWCLKQVCDSGNIFYIGHCMYCGSLEMKYPVSAGIRLIAFENNGPPTLSLLKPLINNVNKSKHEIITCLLKQLCHLALISLELFYQDSCFTGLVPECSTSLHIYCCTR